MSEVYANFKREEFPLIVIEFTGVKENVHNFQSYLKGLEENYVSKKDLALVFDARKALSLNPVYQLKQAMWMQKNRTMIKTYCKGIAYVVPQAVMRKVLQFIFNISPNPVTFKVFEDFDEATAWAKQRLNS